MTNKAILIPQVSIGDIKLDDSIENYPDRALEFSDESGEDAYSCFAFKNTPVQAFVNPEGLIETIRCETECIWQGQNLIGLSYAEFNLLYPEEPDDTDTILVETESGDQPHEVYDYDDLGLQVWVRDGNITLAMASSFPEEE